MKKTIFAIAAVCAAATCLSACNTSCNRSRHTVNEYDALNEMFSIKYSTIDLTVTNTYGEGISLVSTYTLKYSDEEVKVSYSIERFAQISLDASSDYKTKVTGEGVIKDGAVVSGDTSIIENIPTVKYNFKAEYFENTDLTGMYIKADVKSVSGFMGYDLTCTDMKIYATFLEQFYDLEISYKAEKGNSVTIKYNFTL